MIRLNRQRIAYQSCRTRGFVFRAGCFSALLLVLGGCSPTTQKADTSTLSQRQEVLQKVKSRCELDARVNPVVNNDELESHPAYDESNQHRVTHRATVDMDEYERCMKANWPDRYNKLRKEEIRALQKELEK